MSTDLTHGGRFFIVSFPETVPKDDTLYTILDNKLAGIILFAEHCREIDILKSWLAELRHSAAPGFLVAVDQEGGRVQRLTRRFPELEAPRYYGHHGYLDRYTSDLSRVCEKLYEIGINFNLVPTVDLFDSGQGHVLDGRTFGDDPETVVHFARATIEVHHRMGLLCCAKHFPGLGRSSGDPHIEIANTDLTTEEFKNRELKPFADCIEHDVDTIMVTHLKMPQVDEKISLYSHTVVSDWLKQDLRWSGPVISDDLLMTAAAAASSAPAAESFAAGVDILLYGRDIDALSPALDQFTAWCQTGRISTHRVNDADKRLQWLKKRVITYS